MQAASPDATLVLDDGGGIRVSRLLSSIVFLVSWLRFFGLYSLAKAMECINAFLLNAVSHHRIKESYRLVL